MTAAAVRAALPPRDEHALHFIFHSAFCGSTLLADALDSLEQCSTLKEPTIATQLVHHQRLGDDLVQSGSLDFVLRLLGYSGGANATVAKLSCFALPLAPATMQVRPAAKAVLLFGDLHTFLLSVAKRGAGGRAWGRQAFVAALEHRLSPLDYDVRDLLGLTDLQAAGLAWLMRIDFMQRLARQVGASRTLFLDGADFIAEPARVLGQICGFVGIPTDAREVASIVGSELFTRHSKEGRAYSSQARKAELHEAERLFGAEVAIVRNWIEASAARHGMNLPATAI